MTLQTSINLYSIPGQPGQIASLSLFSIYQAIPGWTAGGIIPFGRLVQIDTADNKIKLPSATGQTIIGATVFNMARNAAYLDSGDVDGIPNNGLADIMTKGDIWISCESTTVAPGDKVYVRHTADGTKTTLGGVANAAGTGLDLVEDALFLSTASNGLAVIKLNK
jgi:hypothetical protein